ncbi:dihydrofolate reductase family protein [Patescibacteria group bacterium]|nr:dihydrofolate reductase family protein [Patescibacteria group bacterium]
MSNTMTTPEIRQIEPEEKPVQLEGMYLNHNLQELAKKLGRPVVIANYITDLNDVIAVKDVRGAPEKLKNPSDWRLFQELTAQADVIITGTSYMSEFAGKGESGQNVLTQFDKGGTFEGLGDWRDQNSLKRNPDLVVVSRSLNFSIPKTISESGRKIFIFTIDSMQDSEKAKELKKAGATVIGSGKEGVDGTVMVNRLGQEGYKVIKLTTGPRVLKILMDAKVLDRLYITRVNRTITDDLANAVTVLKDKRVDGLLNEGFRRIKRYRQDKVTTNDGYTTSQEFLVYEKA